jgi:hypothetical protein
MGFPEIGDEATVYMKGPPSIISHKTQFGVIGDTVRVECTAFSIPPPIKVIWSFKGDDIALDNSRDYSVCLNNLQYKVQFAYIHILSQILFLSVFFKDIGRSIKRRNKEFPYNKGI